MYIKILVFSLFSSFYPLVFFHRQAGGYGPHTYERVGLIGNGVGGCGTPTLQKVPTALASITSAAAVAVPLQSGHHRSAVRIVPSPFGSGLSGHGGGSGYYGLEAVGGGSGYRGARGPGLAEVAAVKKDELLNRLLLKKTQKLSRQRAFVGPTCYGAAANGPFYWSDGRAVEVSVRFRIVAVN